MENVAKRKLQTGFILVMACLIFTACSNEERDREEEEAASAVVPLDEELFEVVETNVAMLMEGDAPGYMATIHPDSPVYETTGETIEELFDYSLEIELSELGVEEKSTDEAVVRYMQRTIETGDGGFENNETSGEHVLRKDGDDWKIYQSEVLAVEPLPEEEETIQEAEMSGEYADRMGAFAIPLEEEDWYLALYEEGSGEATAEYIPRSENLGNYSEIFALDFYENGQELSSLGNFVSVLELSLEEMVTGELEFSRLSETESEVIYHFTVSEDASEPNQEEVGRIFLSGEDMFVARYTVMEETIEDTEEIVSFLREVE